MKRKYVTTLSKKELPEKVQIVVNRIEEICREKHKTKSLMFDMPGMIYFSFEARYNEWSVGWNFEGISGTYFIYKVEEDKWYTRCAWEDADFEVDFDWSYIPEEIVMAVAP